MDRQSDFGSFEQGFWQQLEPKETQTIIPIKKVKKTYSQDWATYDFVKSNEKIFFMKILNPVIESLNLPYEYKNNGRYPFSMEDRLKSCILKVYHKADARSLVSDLKLFKTLGYLGQAPSFRSINYFMEDERLKPYLEQLIKLLAEPLIPIESHMAIDSTGFSTFNRKQWIDIRFNKGFSILRKDYKKLHIVTGVKSNIVVSAKVTDGKANDSPHFEDLVKQSAYFDIKIISADAGYLSRKNCEIVTSIRATPFIFPKKNATVRAKGSPAWNHMISLWKNNEKEFRMHYHKRSNVESSFAMIKRNYLPYVRAKSDSGQINEGLCKVVCHNLACLIMSLFEYGIKVKYIDV
ncbi:transposase [Candidatus Woesearchaeota archaeon]|nr:transposase [Candidatus Woesearchaeota archaeon]